VAGTRLRYAWSLTGSNLATLSGGSQAGRNFETDTNTVTLATTPSTQGTLTVAVKVFHIETDGTRTELGDANSIITISVGVIPLRDKIVKLTYTDPKNGAKVYSILAYVIFPIQNPDPAFYRVDESYISASTGRRKAEAVHIIANQIGAPNAVDSPFYLWTRISEGAIIPIEGDPDTVARSNFFRVGNEVFYQFGGSANYSYETTLSEADWYAYFEGKLIAARPQITITVKTVG
jgi:hypothetical protein